MRRDNCRNTNYNALDTSIIIRTSNEQRQYVIVFGDVVTPNKEMHDAPSWINGDLDGNENDRKYDLFLLVR